MIIEWFDDVFQIPKLFSVEGDGKAIMNGTDFA
jgi:hypothetical protein